MRGPRRGGQAGAEGLPREAPDHRVPGVACCSGARRPGAGGRQRCEDRHGGAPAAISAGKHVEVVGTSMAGSIGVAEEFLEAKGRWKVVFASGVAKNFKGDSLRLVPEGRAPKAAARRPPQDAAPALNMHEGNMDRGSRRADKKLPFVGGVMDVLSRMQADAPFREEAAPSVADRSRAPESPPAAAPVAAPAAAAA
ncbi:unnamed protein product, partial [Prorocentrum cordatum]